jgi:hypothetical protein
MTEQSPSTIGTVAQEAARLIEDMATMARPSYSRGNDSGPDSANDSGPYTSEPAPEPAWAQTAHAAGPAGHQPEGDTDAKDEPPQGSCSMCGAENGDTPRHDRSSTCRICPLCRGIELLRSVRPETVDMLADLAISVAGSLRDVATRSRASDPTSAARPTPGGPPEPGRAPVQDIPVDDESEGSRW